MKNYTIRRYHLSDYNLWNAFVSNAKNATFLFHRDFMDHHKDRFEDFSLLVFDKEKLVAILPANIKESEVFSHLGLTYGGLVLDKNAKLSAIIPIFRSILYHLNESKIDLLTIKMLPSFYCEVFSDELAYCLFLLNATIFRADALSTIDLKKPFLISKTRLVCCSKGKNNDLIIKEETNFELFWNSILIPHLDTKYNTKPVHSLEEITKLRNKFPENIRHFNVYCKYEIIAGTTIFVTKNTVHSQYIAGIKQKNELGGLDYLYHHLITNVFNDFNFFDFGNSNEQQGRKLNSGLLFWKESFGAKTVIQNFQQVATANYYLLDNVLL